MIKKFAAPMGADSMFVHCSFCHFLHDVKAKPKLELCALLPRVALKLQSSAPSFLLNLFQMCIIQVHTWAKPYTYTTNKYVCGGE
jgi:hypothetical protein